MRRILAVITVLGLGLLVSGGPASAAGRPFATDLTGAAEVPGPGDPDGSGTIALTVNPGLEQVCYALHVEGLDPVVGGHIHVGTTDVAGDIVVDLMPAVDADGDAAACVDGDRSVLRAIVSHPSNYYVNVHTTTFVSGAIRGQLG